jgi:glycosyltransferase involved in cell wall biosynthesis
MSFENVSYKGDISALTPRLVMPVPVILNEFFRELPLAARKLSSLFKHIYRLNLSSRIHRFLSCCYDDTGEFVFYSYWLNSSAVALAALNHENNARVCRTHGSDIYHENIKTGFNGYQKLCLASLDRIYCASEHGRKYLADQFGECDALQTRYLGVPHPAKPFREKPVDIRDGPAKIVTCSSVDHNKRLIFLLETLRDHFDQKVIWTHIGDGPIIGEMKRLSMEMPKNIMVRWLGQVSNREVHELYRTNAFHAFINTSLSEGIPVSAMEAMNYGIPCLATDVGGTAELVINGGGEVFSSYISRKDFAILLRRFLDRVLDVENELSTQARKMVELRFRADTNYNSFSQELYELGVHKNIPSD